MADASPPPAKIPRTKSPSPPITDATTVPPHASTAAASVAQQFSDEIWEEIMSHCSVFDLFCLRDTGHDFRRIIDFDMLFRAYRDARLFLVWPDGAREWACLTTGEHDDRLCYMKMLCLGPCSICNTWSTLTPISNDLRIRLCGSEDCLSYMFSDYLTSGWFKPRSRADDIQQDALWKLPSQTEFWQPHMPMDIGRFAFEDPDMYRDIRQSTDCRSLRKARLMAGLEPEDLGWDGDSDSDILRTSRGMAGARRLDSINKQRRARMEVTEGLYHDLISWRLWNDSQDLQIRQKNLQIIRKRAKALNQRFDRSHPFIERVVEAHARDVSEIHLAAAERLFPLPTQSKGPWHPDFDHPYTRSTATRIAWPRIDAEFMKRVMRDAGVTHEDEVKVVNPVPAPTVESAPTVEPAPAVEPAPVPNLADVTIAAQSDDNACPDRTPGDDRAPGGSTRKSAPGRSSKTRPKIKQSEKQKVRAWHICNLCQANPREFKTKKELNRHKAQDHPSASATH